MEKDEMRAQVRAMVDGLFSEKEESEIRKKTEEALGKSAETISDLTSALEDKGVEISELETKLSESEESIKPLETELEAAREELETSKSLLKDKEDALEDMQKAKVADERMIELEAAGVARAEKDSQLAKIKDMSDEEFASYKEELVYVRAAVEAELEKANKDLQTKKTEEDAKKLEEDAKKTDELKAKEEGNAATEKKEDDNTDTTPAKIDPGQSAMAAMNMEYTPDSDLMTKYSKLGEAMAAKWKEKE